MIILLLFLIFWQYQVVVKREKELFGSGINSPLQQLLISIFYGIIGGFLGSLILVNLPVNLSNLRIDYLWLVALLLWFFHPRFLCLAYSGGILGGVHLLGFLPDLDLSTLLLLIAVLHLVESILIYLSGAQGASPIFFKDSQEDLIGGFGLYKIWPIPLLTVWGHTFLPFVAVLGYQDLALAHCPEKRAHLASKNLFAYSIALSILTILAAKFTFFSWVAVIFAPLGHEWVIRKGQQDEWMQPACYKNPLQGVMVLDTLPKSLARNLGLKRGDVILAVNGEPIKNKKQLSYLLFNSLPWLDLEIKKEKGLKSRKRCCYTDKQLGVLLVPEPQTSSPYVEISKKKFALWS